MRFTETRDAIVSILQHNLEVQQSGKATDSSILNPYLQGEPGIGKTCCIYSALSILGSDWGSYMLRLADCEPSVLGGQRYPNKDFSGVQIAEPDWHIAIWKMWKEGIKKGALILDEAPRETL